MLFALLLSIVVILYNNVVNRWPPFNGPAYVPVNLVFAGLITVSTAAILDVSLEELVFRGEIGDLLIPIAILIPFAAVVFGIANSKHARLIADKRVAGMQGRSLAYYVLVRIPLGTAVPEEVIFRGALFVA